MTGLDVRADIDGGPTGHVPVMLDEVLAALEPDTGKTIIDGTFGAGGYSRAIMARGAKVVAIDRDPSAVAAGAGLVEHYGGQLALVQGRFSRLDEIAAGCGVDHADGVVLDVGVSSMQLDQAERGFSFRSDGPLDMRMGQAGVSAADVVNRVPRSDLTRIIGILGEEKKASFVARAIDTERQKGEITSTLQLARLIEKAVGRKHSDKIHPATRTFQALRIFINRELEELAKALFAAERLLKEGGRLVVVTFHSLEDRIVKRFFADRAHSQSGSRHLPEVSSVKPTFEITGKAVIKASSEEAERNPRARSAKLRSGTRLAAAARGENMEIFGLPNLASLEGLVGAGAGSRQGAGNA